MIYSRFWNLPSPVTQLTVFLSYPPIPDLLRAPAPSFARFCDTHIFILSLQTPISTYKFSILISIHFPEKLVERICLKIKAFSLSWSFYWFSWTFLLIMYWYLLGENLYWLLLGPEGLRLTICCSCRSPERVRNPHLRAKLAETLEALIPVNRSQNSSGLLSPSSVNMVCIRNLETCAGFQPLHKILPRLHPQSLSMPAIVCFTRRLFVVSDHFRVLSRIYLLGEKSPVANGDKITRGVPGNFGNEYALRCNPVRFET